MLASRQTITQVRNSSGKLKELGIRLKSIRNIEKITKTMKMISSAKFAKVTIFSHFTVTHLRYPFGLAVTQINSGLKDNWSRPRFW